MTTNTELQDIVNNMSDEEYNRIKFRNDMHDSGSNILAELKQSDVHSEQEIAEMRGRYDKAEKKLLEYDIEFRINNFSQFEHATQMINKIEHDLNYI